MRDYKRRRKHRVRKVDQDKTVDLKSTIYYHRAYRKISNPGRLVVLKFLLITLPLIIAIFFLYPKLTYIMSNFAEYTLLSSFSSDSIEMLEKPYMLSNVYMLDFPTTYPSPLFSFILFLFSVLTIVLIPKTKMPKPIALWIIYISFINLISSVFFILVPSIFPYDTKQFSELYVLTEVNMWFFVPVIMGMALLPLPSNTFSKFVVTVLALTYSVIFGVVRYAVFLYIIAKFSFLFMPVLFFSFGPLMDFFYVVSIYSLYVSILSKKAGRDLKAWKWSY